MTNYHARRLPHFHAIGQPIFLTWRLAGSLPSNRNFPSEFTAGQAFVVMDRILDAAQTGPVYLRMPQIANVMVEAIHHRSSSLRQYDLHSYVVMPNHIHLLITPCVPVSKLTHSLKRFTAREANRLLGLTGVPFWQDENYDHILRDQEFERIKSYIERNPVKAGLVTCPEDFAWSSAKPITNRLQVSNLPHISKASGNA